MSFKSIYPMNVQDIIKTLAPLERKVLPHLDKTNEYTELINLSKLKDVEVMRALQWLQNKKVLELKEEVKEIIILDKNGSLYQKIDLPEIRFLKVLDEKGELSINDIQMEAKLSKDEINICIGVLKKKAAIDIKKQDDKLFAKITNPGKKLLEKPTFEQELLQKTFPIEKDKLSDTDKFAFDNLSKRKGIVKTELKKTKTYKLTPIGKELAKQKIDAKDIIDRLTQDIIQKSSWKNKEFRHYDVKINVPKISAGKKQPYRAFLDWVRKKFIGLGFSEMTGPVVESEFWNMDSLFMPQFHSARDIHDAYYIKEPKYAKLDPEIIKKVKAAHENGYNTGSKGWQYEFDDKRTKRHVLRTQGTACSARMLGSKDLKIPGKYFGITRCFRYDVIDATHNVDFYQTEGIVVEEGLNFQHLKGLLKMFAEEFAQTDQIKIKPAYFPFTEPSAELFAKHPDLGWIELGGSGVFRPELVKPLVGKEIPVIAWGMGIDRIGMFNMGIKDIRKLFSPDLEFLRNSMVKY
ncbi:phenylalanine--tRNA ligase subunit alpha [Nanoarchaeota archaeon]